VIQVAERESGHQHHVGDLKGLTEALRDLVV
jgi:hypothetical protein